MSAEGEKNENERLYGPDESVRRRREKVFIVVLGALFLVLTYVLFKLFGISRSLPFVHSIFFFGLVNFNIILFLLLTFLIFRNVVKVFSERQGGVIGSSLKGKLIAAFVGFSFVPTALMFIVSVFYINNSFDKWFSDKMEGVLKNSFDVTTAYYTNAKEKNYHFANKISERLITLNSSRSLPDELVYLQKYFNVDVVEYYPGLFGERVIAQAQDRAIPHVPAIPLEFRKKGVSQNTYSSHIHSFAEGDLVRVIVPINRVGRSAAVVVSSYIPLSLIEKRDQIATAYEDFRDSNPLAYPLKTIYLIILVLMTLVILLGATWFGFYLAKQLTIPLTMLGEAARRIAKREYRKVNLVSGSPEINQLVSDFNTMTGQLESSEREVREVNENLKDTLARLDEHSKYIEVVLTNVSTGVVSIDPMGFVTMINHQAAQLFGIKSNHFIGKQARDVLPLETYTILSELLERMQQHEAASIQKEVRLTFNGRAVPLQLSITVLFGEDGQEVGKVITFNDLSMLVAAQRAAAWNEVARRIAHEIKNPLTPIRLSAQRLQKKFGERVQDPAFQQCTSMIIDQVDGLKELVNEFSHFARLPKSNPMMANLNQTIEEALILFVEGHRDIEFQFSADPDLPEFLFDSQQMKRVIANLVDNSIGAVKEKSDDAVGRIEISTSFDQSLRIARLEIIDNGLGIPQSLRDRIFEPYMTTKTGGTGLGLAIVKRTVEDHNGFIRAFAHQPQGTKMIIELPVVVAQEGITLVETKNQTRQDRLES